MDDRQIMTLALALLTKADGAMSETANAIKAYDLEQRRRVVNFSDDDLNALQQVEEEFGAPLLGSVGSNSGVAPRPSHIAFKGLCRRVYDLAGALRPFIAMDLNSSMASMRIVKLISRLFKALVVLVKDKIRRKDTMIPKFLRQLFDRTASELSPALLQYIACIHEESKRVAMTAAKKGRRATVSGQSKLIPDVIFQLEQYDLALIKLSKLCRGQDFSAWCKLRQSRDFRLNRERIKQAVGDNAVAEKPLPRGESTTTGDKEDSETADEAGSDAESHHDGEELDADAVSENDTESATEEDATQPRRREEGGDEEIEVVDPAEYEEEDEDE
ncbi:hypothetical protein ATCC90586_004140 [Pythium insidiosum]|nr:hypothetical protein ATCC90586_004140 [Pythium insidiosum]